MQSLKLDIRREIARIWMQDSDSIARNLPAAQAIRGVAALALALGEELEALEVNPLIVRDSGAIAVDALLLFAPRGS